MRWRDVNSIGAAVAGLMPRILQRGPAKKAARRGLGFLREDLRPIYDAIANEVEARTTNLGIILNEAQIDRMANRKDVAWLAVGLARRQWKQLSKLLLGMNTILHNFLPSTTGIKIWRRVASERFRSRAVMDYVYHYEFLDEISFCPETRFELQLRFLFRANTVVSKAFKHLCSEGAIYLDISDELWSQMDCYLQDFILLAKETLHAFLTLLICQSADRAQELSSDLRGLIEQGMPDSVSSFDR